MHGSGNVLGALETRAERVDLSGRLIVGGSPLMPMSVHIASGERRDATAASTTGAKPDDNAFHIRSGDVSPPELPDRERVIDPRTSARRDDRPGWRTTSFPLSESRLAVDVLVGA
jgi:hypothetical protein